MQTIITDELRQKVKELAEAWNDECAAFLAMHDDVSIAEIHRYPDNNVSVFYRFTLPTGQNLDWDPWDDWDGPSTAMDALAVWMGELEDKTVAERDAAIEERDLAVASLRYLFDWAEAQAEPMDLWPDEVQEARACLSRLEPDNDINTARVLALYSRVSPGVAEFVDGEIDILELLEKAHKPLWEAFETNTLSLELLDEQLLVLVSTTKEPEEALETLRCFYRKWWRPRAAHLPFIVVDVEYLREAP